MPCIEWPRQERGLRLVAPTIDLPKNCCEEQKLLQCVNWITRMFVFVHDNDSAVSEDHFGLYEVVDAETVQTAEESKSTKNHDG